MESKVFSCKASLTNIAKIKELALKEGIQIQELFVKMLESYANATPVKDPEDQNLIKKLTGEVQQQAKLLAELDIEKVKLENQLAEKPEPTQVNPDHLILETNTREKAIIEECASSSQKSVKELLVDNMFMSFIEHYPSLKIIVPVEFKKIYDRH